MNKSAFLRSPVIIGKVEDMNSCAKVGLFVQKIAPLHRRSQSPRRLEVHSPENSGKAVVGLNSSREGLRACAVVLPSESCQEFQLYPQQMAPHTVIIALRDELPDGVARPKCPTFKRRSPCHPKARMVSRQVAKDAKKVPDRLLCGIASSREIFLPNERAKPIFTSGNRAAGQSERTCRNKTKQSQFFSYAIEDTGTNGRSHRWLGFLAFARAHIKMKKQSQFSLRRSMKGERGADTWSAAPAIVPALVHEPAVCSRNKRRDESRRGRQECPRHARVSKNVC
jgi:hypothetical protein